MAKSSPSTPEVKEAKLSATDYNNVAKSAELIQINLLSSAFEVNPEFLGDEAKWKLKFGRKIISTSYDDANNYVAAIIQFQVEARLGRKKAMQCTADYGIYYSTPVDAKEEAATAFCRQVGSFAIYPYFRGLVAQLAWNAGLTLPPLPSIASTLHNGSKPDS